MADDLVVRIRADVRDATSKFQTLQRQTERTQQRLSTIARRSGVAFAALSAGIGTTITSFARFQSSFSDVVTLLDDSSFSTKTFADGVADLEQSVKSLSVETGKTFADLNKGLFDIVSAGIPAEQSIKALEAATRLAIAGATETSVAVEGLTSALNAYGISAEKSNQVTQKFFQAQKQGKTTVEDLAAGFGLVSATASELNVSLDEVLASVSAATLSGLKTNAAFTGLRAALSNVVKPTQEARDEAERLGVEFNSTALRAQGLEGFLESIRNSAGFTSTTFEKLFTSVEGLNFIQAVAGRQSKAFAGILENLGNEVKLNETFSDALAQKQKDVAFQLGQAKQAFVATTTTIGGTFADEIGNATKLILGLEKRFSNLSAETKETIGDFILFAAKATGLVAATALIAKGALIARNAFLALRTALTFLSGPIGVIVGLGTVIIGLFGDEISRALGLTERSFNNIVDRISLGFNQIILKAQQAVFELKKVTEALGISEAADVSAAADAIIETQQRIADRRIAIANRETEAILQQRVKQAENDKEQQELALERLEEFQEKVLGKQREKNQKELEIDAEFNELKNEIDQERRQAQLEKEAERFEQDQENLRERQAQRVEVVRESQEQETAAREISADRQRQIESQLGNDLVSIAQSAGKSEVAQKIRSVTELVSIAKEGADLTTGIKKDEAITSVETTLRAGAEEAFSNATAALPFPIDLIVGAARFASVIARISGAVSAIRGAQEGGIVPGTGTGDKVPFLLEPGELIVPRPLVPNFADSISEIVNRGGGNGAGGQQNVNVTIDFTDQASQLLTLAQREDRTLRVAQQ